MKIISTFLIFAIFNIASANEWKPVAESVSCGEKYIVLAKEGEKFVLVTKGNQKIKLVSKNLSPFNSNASSMNEFEGQQGEVKYRYFQPGAVEANLPKLDIINSNTRNRCGMEYIK